jgi:hypothetical protein
MRFQKTSFYWLQLFDRFEVVVIESCPLAESRGEGNIIVHIFTGITQVRNDSCHLILVADTSLKSILSEIQNDRQHDVAAVFFDMVTISHLAGKAYEERLWKRTGETLLCFGRLGIEWNDAEEEIEALNQR